MAITVKHTKVSAVVDSADSSLVRPSDWNADHTLVGVGTAAALDAGVANGVATLDSAGKVPVSQIPQLGDLNYQGTWNASTNTPTLVSSTGTKGYYYVVSVAGTTNLNGITDWQIGDWAVFNGTAWQKIDNTDSVVSVNGQTGVVVLTNTDISGFGTMSTQNANNVAITGGSVALSASTTSLVPLHINAGVQPTTPVQGDVWAEGTGLYFHNSVYTNQLNLGSNAAGTLENPVITVAGSGATIDVTSVKVVLFALPGWVGDYKEYIVPAATGLALTDNSANYLIVSYNAGSPVYSITTNPALITNSDVVGATLLWRDGTQVHYQTINWGLSTASRINRRLVQTNRYQRASGLALGESTGNVITLTAGNVWYGVSEIMEGAVTSASSNADFYYHVAGVYTKSTVSTYNITQYDDGTSLQTLSGGRYAVNWVYRYLDGSGLPKLAYVLGTTNATLAQAVASVSPTPPAILTTMAILVGRIIVVKSAATANQIDSAFTQVFSGTTVTSHNDLSGLQGGKANEFFHLTSAEYTGTGTGNFVRDTLPTISSAIISANTSTNALRITQLGTGNAILVEDSANPDATPFVVNASGEVGIGVAPVAGYSLVLDRTSIHKGIAARNEVAFQRANNTVSSPTIVAVDNELVNLTFQGYDGANYVQAARILAVVDGTPGTNDMPGRLVFSTTADGSSSPTERMRIDNQGRVGIGAVSTQASLAVTTTLPAASGFSQAFRGAVTYDPSVTTNSGYTFHSAPLISAGTLPTLRHFNAQQGTYTGSVTNQFGYFADSSLTGATNNYGFYSNLPAGTGRYNFYAAGTADNYFAGNVGLGTSTPGAKLAVVGTGYSPNITLTDAATIAWNTATGQTATFTFTGTNRTMGAPTNLVNGAFYALAVIQNGGSNTLTWNSIFKWAGGVAPTLSTAAGAKDYFTFRSDGTNLYEQGRSLGVA